LAEVLNATSEGERQIILNDRQTRGLIAGLTDEKWDQFVENIVHKRITKKDDARFALELFDMADKGMTPSALKKKVIDWSTGPEAKLSGDKGQELWKFFMVAEQQQKRDPLYMKRINEQLNFIKSYGKPQGMLENLNKGIYGSSIEDVKTFEAAYKFLLLEEKNPGNMKAHALKAVNDSYGELHKLPVIQGVDYDVTDSDAAIADKVYLATEGKSAAEQERIVKQAEEFIKARERKKEYDRRMLEIQEEEIKRANKGPER
jgi:hypothetical protein